MKTPPQIAVEMPYESVHDINTFSPGNPMTFVRVSARVRVEVPLATLGADEIPEKAESPGRTIAGIAVEISLWIASGRGL